MKILHIHQDYPDGQAFPFTKAVSNLISACEENDSDTDHFVLSINRTSNPFKVKQVHFKQGLSVVYWAIPLPFFFIFTMWLSSLWIYRFIKVNSFDVVHGHKLTTEGYFASFFSKRFNIPYVLSVRGGSDCHNLSRLKIHKRVFKNIFKGASHIFWVSAWAKSIVCELLDEASSTDDLLPNICEIDLNDFNNQKSKNTRYVCAISFQQYKRKGILQLIEAISILREKDIEIYLDVYGDGDKAALQVIEQKIISLNLSKQVFLKGRLTQIELRNKIRESRGFIMPSINETFGMTYIESLSVGAPIVYLENTGVDGYFDKYQIGVRLKNQKPISIADAILFIENNLTLIESEMSKMFDSSYLFSFTGKQVANKYLSRIRCVI